MKKFLLVVMTLYVTLFCTFSLNACSLIEHEPHVCEFETNWTYDNAYHYYKCKDTNCTEVSQKGEHAFVNGVCVCGYEEPHVCEFETNWTYDNAYHYYKCKGTNCTEVSQKGEHAFVNGVCVCGYEDSTYVPPITTIDFTELFDIENVTITVAVMSDTEEFSSISTKKIDGNKWVEESLLTGSKIIYYFDGESFFVDGTSADISYYFSLVDIAYLLASKGSSFIELEDGVYYAESIEISETYLKDVIICVVDDKINAIQMGVGGENEGEVLVYTFSDYGTTDIAELEMEEPSFFSQLFNIENATITITIEENTFEGGDSIEMASRKIDGNRWVETSLGFDAETYLPIDVVSYFDGENLYVDGVLTDSSSHLSYIDIVFILAGCESYFIETEKGIYFAETVEHMGVVIYENVTITIVEDKIYTIEIIERDEVSESIILYTFSNYGTTEVIEPEFSEPSYFEELIKFDNATCEQYLKFTIDNDEYKQFVGCTKISGETWAEYVFNADDVNDYRIKYFDGTNLYCNGILNNNYISGNKLRIIKMLIGTAPQEDFNEIEEGVYFYSDSEGSFTIITQNDKLYRVEISYTDLDSDFLQEFGIQNAVLIYEFSDYETTNVVEPIIEEPTEFMNLFTFENVTVDLNFANSGLDSKWKIEGDKWCVNSIKSVIDNTVRSRAFYAFDGINYYYYNYVNNELQNEGSVIQEDGSFVELYNINKESFFEFMYYEDKFTALVQGNMTVYTAEEIDVFGITSETGTLFVWTDVEITVVDGRITKIQYTRERVEEDLNNGNYYSGTITYTFSDYGTTVVEFYE